MVKAEFNGLMGKLTREIIKTIENMVLVHFAGRMVENMLVFGRMESNMAEDNIFCLIRAKK